jgi:lysozyme
VLVEMAFQLGASRLAGFSKFRQAVMDRLWVRASSEMSDSLWARQTPKRAQELAERMIHG